MAKTIKPKKCQSCGSPFYWKRQYGHKLWVAKKYCSLPCFGEAHKTHGMSKTKIYAIWRGVLSRCYNPNVKSYKDYGARGIKVCRAWHKFEQFYTDMGDCPPGFTIDRKNNDKGYSPSNCKWSTWKEQCNNRRTSNIVSFDGKSMSLMRWTELLGLPYPPTCLRIMRYGWTPERAFKTPIRVWPSQAAIQKAGE